MSKTEKKAVEKAPVEKTGSNDSNVVRLTVTLFAICAACALVLGLTNMVTKPVIEANQERKKTEAITADVMPGYTGILSQVNYTGSDKSIRSILKGSDGSFVVEVAPGSSFSGTLALMVGIDPEGKYTGLSIVESGETSGLGARASEPEWRAQFVGKSGQVAITKDGGQIEAISGASITSRAVCSGVNAAMEAINYTADGPYVAPEPGEDEETGDDLEDVGGVIPGFSGEAETVAYTGGDATIRSIGKAGTLGYIVEVAPEGSFSGTLVIQVGIGADGKVTGVGILESGETDALGGRASEPEFADQFIGKSGEIKITLDGGEIEAIASASMTSRAVCAGVTAALAAVAGLG